MTHLRKLRTPSILKWVSSYFDETHFIPLGTPARSVGSFLLYTTKRNARRIQEAQAALLDYLYRNRGLHFADAENMSKNSPHFLNNLLKCGGSEPLSRYLLYHPFNEFEPFFESLGLKPSEYVHFLPPKSFFLVDESLLLHNYAVLCRYRVERNRIGKIYKEATEVFRYDFKVLQSKFQAYEELGLSRYALCRFVVASPGLLVEYVDVAFLEVLEKLRNFSKPNL